MNYFCGLAVVVFHHDIVRGLWHNQEVSLIVGNRLPLDLHPNDNIYLASQSEQRRSNLLGWTPKGWVMLVHHPG